jgi:hypothetical protein
VRHNYVADRGDFFKFGLLLTLCQAGLSLGIIWYLFPDEEPKYKSHGRDIDYLQKEAYRQCNPGLFEALKPIAALDTESRKVQLIHTAGIFPTNTVFHDDPLSLKHHDHFLHKRLHRREWFQRVQERTLPCDMVYLDPDTGLEIKSKNPYQKNDGPKYLSYDEVKHFIDCEQTVIVFQNRHREAHEAIADSVRSNFQFYLNFQDEVPVYYFKQGTSSRMFFILPAKRHQEIISTALAQYDISPWQQFFHRI